MMLQRTSQISAAVTTFTIHNNLKNASDVETKLFDYSTFFIYYKYNVSLAFSVETI